MDNQNHSDKCAIHSNLTCMNFQSSNTQSSFLNETEWHRSGDLLLNFYPIEPIYSIQASIIGIDFDNLKSHGHAPFISDNARNLLDETELQNDGVKYGKIANSSTQTTFTVFILWNIPKFLKVSLSMALFFCLLHRLSILQACDKWSSIKLLLLCGIIWLYCLVPCYASNFVFVSHPMSWYNASIYCNTNYGTTLASIHDEADQQQATSICTSGHLTAL